MQILLSKGIAYDHDITQQMDCVILLRFLYLASFVVNKYMIFEYAGFLWLTQVQQHIYLQDYRRHSVTVSQKRNDHMQVYIFLMEGK